jgi:CelD/BcsL family acetyltransferase involved in cellulose biosynthesis
LKRAALGTGFARNVADRPAHYPGAGEGSVAPLRKAGTHAAPAASEVGGISISLHRSVGEVAAPWRDIERTAHCTLYQTLAWCDSWVETVAAARGIGPLILVGRHGGTVRFMLPLQVARRGGVDVLEWLGAPHVNYGGALVDPSFRAPAAAWFERHWARLMALIPGIDAVALAENPHQLFGRDNPLAGLFTARGPNISLNTRLAPNFAEVAARHLSGGRRRGVRKRRAALARHGELAFAATCGKAELHRLIDTMFDQQRARLAEQGVHGVFGPAERQFLHRLAERQDETAPVLAPCHLTLDGDVLAVMLGGLHDGVYWALVSSLTAGPMRRHSPGEIALHQTIEACCARGLWRFDFSAGDAPYKRVWADEVVETSVIVAARSRKGRLWAMAYLAQIRAKGAIKRSPRLNAAAMAVRRILLGHPRGGATPGGPD